MAAFRDILLVVIGRSTPPLLLSQRFVVATRRGLSRLVRDSPPGCDWSIWSLIPERRRRKFGNGEAVDDDDDDGWASTRVHACAYIIYVYVRLRVSVRVVCVCTCTHHSRDDWREKVHRDVLPRQCRRAHMGLCVAIDSAELAREHSARSATVRAVSCARACDAFGVDDVLVFDSRRIDDDDDDDDGDGDGDGDVKRRGFDRGVREVSAPTRARDFFARICDAVACPRALRQTCVGAHEDLKLLGGASGGALAANATRDKDAMRAMYCEGVVVNDDGLSGDGRPSTTVVDCGRGVRYRVTNAKRAIPAGTRVTVRPKRTKRDDDGDGDDRHGVDDGSGHAIADVVSPDEAKAHMGCWPYVTRTLARGELARELEKYALVVVVDDTLTPSPRDIASDGGALETNRGSDGDDGGDVLTNVATRAKTENVLVMFGEVARLFRAETVDIGTERARRAIVAVDAFGRTHHNHVVESQSLLRVDESMWVVLARAMLS